MAKLGRTIAQTRLAANLTQAGLAAAAGLSRRTVERIEAGRGGQLMSLVRCMRVLNQVEGLEQLAPERRTRSALDLLDLRAESPGPGALSRLWWS